MPEFLPGVDVRQVDFDGRNADSRDGVPQGDAGVGVGGGVQDDDIELPLGLLNPANQFTLQIGLAELDRCLELASARARTLASMSAKVVRP